MTLALCFFAEISSASRRTATTTDRLPRLAFPMTNDKQTSFLMLLLHRDSAWRSRHAFAKSRRRSAAT